MSTYNGEKYLREQLDSLLAQTLCKKAGWDVGITVRDDGSSDATCEILEEYAGKYPQISYYTGKNLGVIGSFFDLVCHTPDDVDLMAFCDQDDVWMEDKMETAAAALDKKERQIPLLYCCMVQTTDENMNPLDTVFFNSDMRPSFGNALVENICTGCTAVFNRELAELIRVQPPSFTVMHDWWLYILATCFGEVIHDSTPHMYYRQHGGNTVGVKKNYVSEFVARVKRFRKNRYNISRQAGALWQLCEEQAISLPKEKAELIRAVLDGRKHIRARLRLMRDPAVYRQRKGDDLIFKLIILTGTM